MSDSLDSASELAAPASPAGRDSGVAAQGRKVYLWPDAFEQMRSIQRAQRGSPRFDLGDLTSAAVYLLADDPEFARRVVERARLDFLRRFGAVG